MIGRFFCYPFELINPEMIVCENVINTQCRRQRRKGTAHAKAFLDKRILHISSEFKIRIGIGYIIQVATKNTRVRAVA